MSYVKPLPSHAKCCASRLDRLRHEYDRGLKMLAYENARMERDGKEPRERRLREIETFITARRHELAAAEKAALES